MTDRFFARFVLIDHIWSSCFAYFVRAGCLAVIVVWLWTAIFSAAAIAGEPAAPGYADYPALTEQLQSLAKENADLATLTSLGRTRGKRDVWLLTLSKGDPKSKPAILVLGSVDAANLVGSELAVRMARGLLDGALELDETVDSNSESKKQAEEKQVDKLKGLLERVTVYIIPRPSPDGSERFFEKPYTRNAGNERPTDDDRDGKLDEDGPEDLNGDGWITAMRVEDPTGEYMEHPQDPRVMIKADPRKKNERGRFRIYSEGIDNDGDEHWNEDSSGGVDFNRNFTFAYPYFSPGAGPHQVSEPETRAVADFAYSQPNLFAVFSFSTQDNLSNVWKVDARAENARIKKALRKNDGPYFDYVAAKYRKILNRENAPPSSPAAGDLTHWAYFHLGRWSLASRGWWIPETPVESEKSSKSAKEETRQTNKESTAVEKANGSALKPEEKKKPAEDKRGADELNRLRWYDQQGIEGFVPWTKVDHPDFPGKRVEVGGFKPYLQDHAPVAELDPLAEKHVGFLATLDSLRPRLLLDEMKVEKLGGGIYRVTATVRNDGYLPTVSTMGSTTRQPQSLQMEISLPEGMQLITGEARNRVEPLAGGGGKSEQVWLISLGEVSADKVSVDEAKEKSLKVRAWAPSVGSVEKTFELE